MKSFLIFGIIISLLNIITMLYLAITLDKSEGFVLALPAAAALVVFAYEYKKRF